MNNSLSKCHLCDKEKKLINAHIIPQWAYMELYKNKDRKKSIILVDPQKKYLPRMPIGVYDKNILCKECDNYLGKYDTYGKEILLEKTNFTDRKDLYILNNIDTKKICLFVLSILFRASVSTNENFNEVQLGIHEKTIKNILLNQKYLDKYMILLCKFEIGNLKSDIVNLQVMSPKKLKINGINFYAIYLPHGLQILVKIDSRKFEYSFPINVKNTNLYILSKGNYIDSQEYIGLLNAMNNKQRYD